MAKVDPTEDGPYTYVMRGSQQHAEESVASYMKKKEADTNSKKAITFSEVEELMAQARLGDLFDEDMVETAYRVLIDSVMMEGSSGAADQTIAIPAP